MSTLEEKLAMANAKVPTVYEAGKSCKDMTDFAFYFYAGYRLNMLNQVNTCKGVDFTSMFNGCTNLTTIPELNTSKGVNFTAMFYGCSELTTIPALETSKGRSFKGMFGKCSKLTILPLLDFSSANTLTAAFDDCVSLNYVRFLEQSIKVSISFASCTNLTADSLASIGYGLSRNPIAGATIALSEASWRILENDVPRPTIEVEPSYDSNGNKIFEGYCILPGSWVGYLTLIGWDYSGYPADLIKDNSTFEW